MSKAKSIRKGLFKFLLFLLVAIAIMFFVLSRISGQNEQLRQGLEQFLSSATGSRAVIGDLNYMGFFPDIRFDLSNVIFQTVGDPTDIQMTVDHYEMRLPFMHYILGRKTVKVLVLETLNARAGFLTPKSLSLKSLKIETDPTQKPVLKAIGEYGEDTFEASLELESQPLKNGELFYSLADAAPLQILSDQWTLKTSWEGLKKGTAFRDIQFTMNDQGPIITGEVTLMQKKNGATDLTWTLKSGDSDMAGHVTIPAPLKPVENKKDADVEDEGVEDEGADDPAKLPNQPLTGKVHFDLLTDGDYKTFQNMSSRLASFLLLNEADQFAFDLEATVTLTINDFQCGTEKISNINTILDMKTEAGMPAPSNLSLSTADLGLTEDSPCATTFEQ